MRRILGLLLLFAVVLFAAWWIGHLVGAIDLEVAGYSIRTSASVAVVLLLLLFAALYFVLRLLASIFGLPGAFRRAGSRRRRGRGDDAVTAALVALAARDAGDARRQSARAIRHLGETPQTLLLAAYAGAIAGDEKSAEAAFEKLAKRKDGRFLGLRGLLRQAMERGDYARAAELAREAEAANPGAAWVREERRMLAARTGAWSEALLLTDESRARAAYGAAAAAAETDPKRARKLAKAAWEQDRALAPAAVTYATKLREAGRSRAAADVLRQAWAASPHPDLAEAALADSPDKLTSLKRGQDLVRLRADAPESHLLLGRLSLSAGQVAEARRHAEAALSGGVTQRRVHLLRADIAEAEGDQAAQRAALREAAEAEADPGWRCTQCGSPQAKWAPSCSVCHTSGSVVWGVAPKGLLPFEPSASGRAAGTGDLLD